MCVHTHMHQHSEPIPLSALGAQELVCGRSGREGRPASSLCFQPLQEESTRQTRPRSGLREVLLRARATSLFWVQGKHADSQAPH